MIRPFPLTPIEYCPAKSPLSRWRKLKIMHPAVWEVVAAQESWTAFGDHDHAVRLHDQDLPMTR